MAGYPIPQAPFNKFSQNTAPGTASTEVQGAPGSLAELYEEQWEDYKRRFQPLEQVRLDLQGDAANARERTDVVEDVTQAYDRAPRDFERLLTGYGFKPRASQLKSFNKKLNTQEGLDRVTAYNRATATQDDRMYGLLGGLQSPNANLTGGNAGPLGR